MITEPTLELDEIQGHVLPGFATKFATVLGFKIASPEGAGKVIINYLPQITRLGQSYARKQERKLAFISGTRLEASSEVQMSLSFSGTGLKRFGVSLSQIPDDSFISGMIASAPILGDLTGTRSDPVNWKFGSVPDNTPDFIMVLASDDEAAVTSQVTELRTAFAESVDLILMEPGARLDGDKEHFGFKDAISQPALRGMVDEQTYFSTRYISADDPRSLTFAKPGQPLIWPGQIIFGYPTQNDDPLIPNDIPNDIPKWLKNGSFLVFRKLNQDVPLFDDSFTQLATDIKTNYGETISPEVLKAKFVGRWPDGTPLTASPLSADPVITGDRFRENNFSFRTDSQEFDIVDETGQTSKVPAVEGDVAGAKCPYFAHIRKVNPRDDSTEIGTEKTKSKYILRRGISFGPPVAEDVTADRGLLFMSYQTSIKNQFEFLQQNWANSNVKPSHSGHDFIIGKSGLPANRRLAKFDWNGKEIRIAISAEWVYTTGGGYFFTPSITTIKDIVSKKLPEV